MTFGQRMVSFAVGLAVLGYGVICGILYFNQERMMFHPEVLADRFQFRFAGSFDETSIAEDGANLSVLHFRVRQPKGVIVYFHGNAGSLRTWGANGETLASLGYDVVMVDYRGYGKSSGQISSERELLNDAMAVYDFAASQYPESRIVVWGRSLGSGLATWLASKRTPRLLVLESAYFSFHELARRSYPFVPDVLMKYRLPTNEWIAQVKCPIYLIHGTRDDVIPLDSSERLGQIARARHELIPIHGVGHNDLTKGNEYGSVIASILQ